jgi:hypothetical protein
LCAREVAGAEIQGETEVKQTKLTEVQSKTNNKTETDI